MINKKKFIFACLLSLCTINALAQSFTFEGTNLKAEGWTTSSNTSRGVWTLEKYADNSQFQRNLSVPDDGGKGVAMATTGGRNAMGSQDVDLWLVSPEIVIPADSRLSVAMAWNASFNSSSSVEDEERYTTEIMLLPAGSDISEDGAAMLMQTQLMGLNDWGSFTFELGQYAGQTRRIAFRQHGTPNVVNYTAAAAVSQQLFIDNVTLTSNTIYDMALIEAPAFAKNGSSVQPVNVTVRNNAMPIDAFRLSYQIGDQPAVTETVNHHMDTWDTYTHSFATPAHFLEIFDAQPVKVWVDADNDVRPNNNSAETSATIAPLCSLPIEATDSELSSVFSSNSSRSDRGWSWGYNLFAWVYTQYNTNMTYFLTTRSRYAMTEGELPVKLRATVTASASMNIYLTHDNGERELIGTIALDGDPGEVKDYSQVITVPTAGEYLIALQPEIEAGGKVSLHSISIGVTDEEEEPDEPLSELAHTYQIPYSTSFENEQDVYDWVSLNPGKTGDYWGIEETPNIGVDGTHTMYINRSGFLHDDWIVSPIINITSDAEHRVSFYHATRNTADGSRLSTYLIAEKDFASATNTTQRVAALKQHGILFATDPLVQSFKYANAYFAATPGNYRIAIHNDGGFDEAFLENFSIDDNAEIVMTGVDLSETGVSYGSKDVKVTAYILNAGKELMTDASITYSVYRTDAKEPLTTVTEQLDGQLAPKESADYTFKQTFDALADGVYYVVATLSTDTDTDSHNNTFTSSSLTIESALVAPVKIGFEASENNSHITMSPSESWGIGNHTPYEGTGALSHQYAASAEGDWAFLPRMTLESGKYEFSYFWKTMTGGRLDSHLQSFDVVLCNEANPESIVKVLDSKTNTVWPEVKAKKELTTIDITQPGNYYIGVKVTTTSNQGSVTFDNFEIYHPADGEYLSLAETTTDFSQDWYHYHPARSSVQWVASADGKSVATERVLGEGTDLIYTPGMLRSPAFEAYAGTTYYITYTTTVTGASDAAVVLKASQFDTPDNYTEIGRSTNADGQSTVVCTYTPSKYGRMWFAFDTEGTSAARFEVSNFSIYRERNGVQLNEENFPDPTFRGIIARFYDYDKDGWLEFADVADITKLNMNGQLVYDITGVEYFENLEELVMPNNNIEAVDLSHNPKLRRVQFTFNKLSEIDLSHNPLLTDVSLGQNQLTSVNLSGCSKVTNLNLALNKLESVDLTDCISLTYFSAPLNQLKSLDVSSQTQLGTIYCYGNQLVCIDLSANTDLGVFTSASYMQTSPTATPTFYTNERYVELDDNNSIDLNLAFGEYGFDASRIVAIKGGTLNGNVLTFNDEVVEYQYDTNNREIDPMHVILHANTFNGINDVTISGNEPGEIYDLYGRKVKDMHHNGVYIINGHKFINK